MLDINFITENTEKVKWACEVKNLNPKVVDEVLRLDEEAGSLRREVEELRGERNSLVVGLREKPSEEQVRWGQEVKERLKDMEPQLNKMEGALRELMFQVPNVPAEDVPVGKDESRNKIVREEGDKPKFNFKVRDHVELGEKNDLIDLERGVKIGGFRGFFTRNEAVLMEYGLLDLAMRHMVAQGFCPMTVPWMVKDEALWGTGYFPWGLDDHYTTQDGEKLIGTAEVSLTAYYSGEVLNENDLPVKLVGISPCFRREVGTYGKDSRGIFRLHQFNKVEQVVLSVADEADSREWHEKMLSYSEHILKILGLPYRVVLMCTGDLGAPHRKKYDLDTWFPAQEKYRETHSDSYFLDFQARRLNMRYRAKDGSLKYVYTLNNTVVATPRILAAIWENYQNEDGSIRVPEVLVPYVGKEVISPNGLDYSSGKI